MSSEKEKIYSGYRPLNTYEGSKMSENEEKQVTEMMKETKETTEWVTRDICHKYLVGWGSLDKAKEKLMETIKWRQHFDFTPYRDTSNIMYQYGFTRDGYPVIYLHLNRLKLIKKDDDCVLKTRLIVTVLESALRVMPRGRSKVVLVVDSSKIDLGWASTLVTKFGKHFATIGDHYCEILETAFVVNSGMALRTLYGIARIFLHERTQKKYIVEKNCQILKKHIDVDEIPEFFGGNSKFVYNFDEHMKWEESQKSGDVEKKPTL